MKPVENLEFSEDQLNATKKGIDHLVMPNFKGLGKEVAKDLHLPPPETEEERMARLLDDANLRLAGFPPRALGYLARVAYKAARRDRKHVSGFATQLQARTRGALARNAYHALRSSLHSYRLAPTSLQAHARGFVARRRLQELRTSSTQQSDRIMPVQAQIRGLLARRRLFRPIQQLDEHEQAVTLLQSRIRGILTRRTQARQQQSISSLSDGLSGFQAAARRCIAQDALLSKIQLFRSQSPTITKLQAVARRNLARSKHEQVQSELSQMRVDHGVCDFQRVARALLTRRAVRAQTKELEDRQGDVTAFQTLVRQKQAADAYQGWLHHLKSNQHIAIFLQCLMRGCLARNRFHQTLGHYHEHMEKVVKVQSVFRRKQQAQQYNELTRGRNVPINTVKNFLHLLQDSDYDYAEELEVEHLRKNVIQAIRDNQVVESEVNELDTKIALLVRNKMSLDDVLHTKRNGLSMRTGNQQAILAANNDPFSNKSLDRYTQHRLDLYQEMFYLLQTDGDYMARLFRVLSNSPGNDKLGKDMERIVMSLFGYAQQSREEYLLLKLIQRSLHEEIMTVASLKDFVSTDFLFLKLTMQYGRSGKGAKYLRDVLSAPIQGMDPDIDLEADPVAVRDRLGF
jgi:Ras GTPase-activating-like protein IQGAP2/3